MISFFLPIEAGDFSNIDRATKSILTSMLAKELARCKTARCDEELLGKTAFGCGCLGTRRDTFLKAGRGEVAYVPETTKLRSLTKNVFFPK